MRQPAVGARVLIGLLSDTHDNLPALRFAALRLRAMGVGFVLHAGDVTQPATLRELAGFRGAVVLGNNDGPDVADAAREIGWEAGDAWAGELGGLRIAMVHGHDRRALRDALASKPDLLVTGHTHRARDDTIEGVRVVNPGALYRAVRYSCAALDAGSRRLEEIGVPKSGGF